MAPGDLLVMSYTGGRSNHITALRVINL
jgi:hypothetical protein